MYIRVNLYILGCLHSSSHPQSAGLGGIAQNEDELIKIKHLPKENRSLQIRYALYTAK